MTELRDMRFYEDGVKRVEVGRDERIDSDIVIALWPDGRIGFEHQCPGIWRDPSEEYARYLIAPFWPGQIISSPGAPLTLTPSLLCLGSANPCGLHGFVTDGVWRSC